MNCPHAWRRPLNVQLSARIQQHTRRTDQPADRAPTRPRQIEFLKQPTTLTKRTVAEIVVIENQEVERDERDVLSG